MATNVNVQDLVNEAIKQLTPTLAEAIAKALAMTAQTAQTDDTQTAPQTPQTAPKGKGGFRKGGKHIDSDFTVTEGEINVCEYSDKSIAIWGDTKDKADLIDYIKRVGTHDKHKANFVTPLSAISSRPVGWTINKTALEANGGLDEFLDSIQGLGFNVVLRDSVKDVFEANKAAREQSKGNDKPQTPTPTTDKPQTPTPTPTTGKGKGKGADKPSIAPTDEQRKGADKTTAQTPTPKVVPLAAKPTTIKGLCYDNDKSEEGYKKTERNLTKRGAWYFAQGTKGAAIYANIGLDCETQTAIYVCIAKVKGDITASVMPEFKTWDGIAADPYKAMTDGKLKASMALMYAYYDLGAEQNVLDSIFEKIAA